MSQPDTDTIVMNFVSHGELAIAATPDEVWPAILDTNGWHGTNTVSVGGPKGEVGERFNVFPMAQPDGAATTVSDANPPMLTLETAEIEPGRRRTVRIHGPDGSYTGYSSWRLTGEGEGTVVAYDAYCFFPFPKAYVTETFHADAQKQNLDGLQRLKAFVEGARP